MTSQLPHDRTPLHPRIVHTPTARATRRTPRSSASNSFVWRRTISRFVGLLAAVIIGALSIGQPVSAHSDLKSSTPAKDSTVTDPVTTMTLEFAKPVVTTSESFVVVAADGSETILNGQSSDSLVFVLPVASALPNGATILRFSVVATSDAHAISGEIPFTVDVAAPATTQAATPPTTPSTAAAAASSPAGTAAPAAPASTPATVAAAVPDSVFLPPPTVPGATPLAAASTVPTVGGGDGTALVLVLVAAIGLGVLGAKALPRRSKAA